MKVDRNSVWNTRNIFSSVVLCEECNAPPGLPCITPTGLLRPSHLIRQFQHSLIFVRIRQEMEESTVQQQ
jgi:hypothetical protein